MTDVTETPIPSLTVYESAVELLRGGCEPAKLARQLGIGHIVAADVFVRLEREGIVSKVAKDGTRKVLA